MSAPLRTHSLPMTTQAAEGLVRRRWSVAEIEAMVAAEVLSEDERFELIGGEVVPMSPKGNRHELLKTALANYWIPRQPPNVRLAPETTFRVTEDTFLEPDFVFYDVATGLVKLSPTNALLVVEVSDSSLGYDLGRKALLYAAFGVRELWVLDAVRLEAHVHRRPGPEGYAEKRKASPTEAIAPLFAPDLSVTLGELSLV